MKIIYVGTNYFASTILTGLLNQNIIIDYVFTKFDVKSGRGLKLKSFPVKNVSCINNLKLLEINNIRFKFF